MDWCCKDLFFVTIFVILVLQKQIIWYQNWKDFNRQTNRIELSKLFLQSNFDSQKRSLTNHWPIVHLTGISILTWLTTIYNWLNVASLSSESVKTVSVRFVAEGCWHALLRLAQLRRVVSAFDLILQPPPPTHINFNWLFLSSLWSDLSMWGHFFL